MPIATDPLSLLFLACFFFGLIFLVVTALLGNFGHGGHSIGHGGGTHVHLGGHVGGSTHQMIEHMNAAQHAVTPHGTHMPHSANTHTTPQQTVRSGFSLFVFLNPTTIVLFLLGFGFFGYVFHNLADWLLPFTLFGAAIGGVIVAALIIMMLARIFGNSEGETIQDVSDRVGLIGKVSMTIREQSIGEIIYTSPGGMRKSIPARATDGRRIERGQEVVVLSYEHGIAEVDTWEHFLEQSQEHSSTSSASQNSDALEKLRALLEETDSSNAQALMQNDAQKE
jgi:hypothetical protein